MPVRQYRRIVVIARLELLSSVITPESVMICMAAVVVGGGIIARLTVSFPARSGVRD